MKVRGTVGGVTQADDAEWEEMAVLCAVAAGAATGDVARAIGRGDDLGQERARQSLADLTRRGLLRPDPVAEGAHVLTERGRQVIVDRIGAWAVAGARLGEERRHVERLRTDLLATISHELRTPLTLIRTSIGLLLDSEPDEEMRLRLLRNIKQSTDRMHLLVADLLDLARMRGDRLDLQLRGVDLGELVAGAVSLLRPLLDEKDQCVTVTMPEPAPIAPGDYRRLERVLLNLLGNANKFADAGTTIALTILDDGPVVRISVRDQGPGIPEAAMPHLFDQFFTARTSSSRHNIGAGLGLPIAKGIIEAHGGSIWVESRVGSGTAVSFTLPKAWPPEERDEDPGR